MVEAQFAHSATDDPFYRVILGSKQSSDQNCQAMDHHLDADQEEPWTEIHIVQEQRNTLVQQQ